MPHLARSLGVTGLEKKRSRAWLCEIVAFHHNIYKTPFIVVYLVKIWL
jgi:hypothetical protein